MILEKYSVRVLETDAKKAAQEIPTKLQATLPRFFC